MSFTEQEPNEPLFEGLARTQLIDSLESRAKKLPMSALPEEEMIETFNCGLRIAATFGWRQRADGLAEVKTFAYLPDVGKSLFVDFHRREGDLRLWLIEGIKLPMTSALGFEAEQKATKLTQFVFKTSLNYEAEPNLSLNGLSFLARQLGFIAAYLRYRENRSRVFVFGMP